jgi:hypothetical protein
MAKRKGDLLAAMEDDLKQFWAAFTGALRVAPRAMAERVGLVTRLTNDRPAPRPRAVEETTSAAAPPEPNGRARS